MDQSAISLKLLLVGEGNVGKTSLLVRFAEDQFADSYADFESKVRLVEIGGRTVKVVITDTAGQENFRTLTGGMYHSVSGVFCVYDITNQESFDKLDTWVKGTRRYVPGNDVIVSVIGNKTDLASERVISTAQGQKFASDNGMEFYETSALSGENVMSAFEHLIEGIMDVRSGNRGRSSDGGSRGCCLLM